MGNRPWRSLAGPGSSTARQLQTCCYPFGCQGRCVSTRHTRDIFLHEYNNPSRCPHTIHRRTDRRLRRGVLFPRHSLLLHANLCLSCERGSSVCGGFATIMEEESRRLDGPPEERGVHVVVQTPEIGVAGDHTSVVLAPVWPSSTWR